MDYAFLRREGIRQLERMTGKQWTDFNAHDPGITLLEQLCYALTDLGYRTDYELPDLLANGGGDPYESLHPPAEILTSRPVTPADLRRLALDVNGVKNAWVELLEEETLYHHPERDELSLSAEPSPSEPVMLKGLYHVLIEATDEAGDNGTQLRASVARRLHANRGLCEDFAEIEVLEPQLVQVDATMEIGPMDDAVQIRFEIIRKLADEISPPVPFSSLEKMLESGKSFDEIFDGPRLEHGFIPDEVLENATRRIAINTSDLIHAIMDVKGVRAVNQIQIVREDGSKVLSSFRVASRKVAKLDIKRSTITLMREGKVIPPRAEEPTAVLAPSSASSGGGNSLALPVGRDRNVGRYWSVRHHLPALYGVGELGLPASAPPERKAQARQLEAYLMFFDQLMANYLAQLAHVKELFSYDSPETRTYFTQSLSQSGLDFGAILPPQNESNVLSKSLEASGGTGADRDVERKNRFLNHLLARFAEEIDDPGTSSVEGLTQRKQAFLRRYPRLSGARGTSFNYFVPPGENNRAGLEERLRLKLGLVEENGESFFIIEHILLRPMEGDNQQTVPLLAAAASRDPYSLQLSFVFAERGRFKKDAESNEEAKRLVEQAVRMETPAHLTPYIRWMANAEFELFQAAYLGWLEELRAYSAERFNVGLEELGS
ncbi:hypothetical protein [Vitiosangium sp. GDMCC 1.1324]|uniref:hypothetical protein n=1 Tax=Vitiosangium sp. (strain GDMCC 1.1324) TaxID=2138576 RepID=UPI000D3CF92B|nr:hypothetical protein [Vitiosangium sp. GDMCC 1.1324]PTL78100.1 hypothetical protein DAT35_41540 [Vitiosangium sp. GDMCC 1.1324]